MSMEWMNRRQCERWIEKHAEGIVDFSSLRACLQDLHPGNLLFFVRHFRQHIQDFQQFYQIFKLFPLGSRGHLVSKIPDYVMDFHSLVIVLANMKAAHRLSSIFAVQYKVYNILYLLKLLPYLSSQDGLILVLHFKTVIKDAQNLSSVLSKLLLENRYVIALEMRRCITDVMDLVNILKCLAKGERQSFAFECQDLILNGQQLSWVLMELSLKERMAFVARMRSKILGIQDLLSVIPQIAKYQRFDVMMMFLEHIQTVHDLKTMLRFLESGRRLAYLLQRKVLVTTIAELAEVLAYLLAWEYVPCILEFQDFLQSWDDIHALLLLIPSEQRAFFLLQLNAILQHVMVDFNQLYLILRHLPEGDRYALAVEYRHLIGDGDALGRTLRVLGLTDSKAYAFVEHCSLQVYVHYCLKKNVLPPLALRSAYIQQGLKTRQISGFSLLLSYATDPTRYEDYIALLNHPSLVLLQYDQRGRTLATLIRNSALEVTDQQRRLDVLSAVFERRRQGFAGEYLCSYFKNLCLELSDNFPDEVLPAGTILAEEGVIATQPLRFERLHRWLVSQEFLSESVRAYFLEFQKNPAFYNSRDFSNISVLFEALCTKIYWHHRQQRPLIFSVQALKQLQKCSGGIRSALEELYYSIGGIGFSQMEGLVVMQVKGKGAMLNRLFQIEEIYEVHLSIAAVLERLGIAPALNYSDDPSGITIAEGYLDVWADEVCLELSRSKILEVCMPVLPLVAGEYSTFNPEHNRKLNESLDLLQQLQMIRLLPVDSTLAATIAEQQRMKLLQTLSPTNIELGEQWRVEQQAVDALKQQIAVAVESQLVEAGLLGIVAQEIDLQDFIWRYLTCKDLAMLAESEHSRWTAILQARDGLTWIRRVIQAHAGQEQQLQPASFLSTGLTVNLFQKILCNFKACEWFFGFEVDVMSGMNLVFTKQTTPFIGLITELNTNDRYAIDRQLSLAYVLPLRGNLIYWLYRLQRDVQYAALFRAAVDVVCLEGWQRYDSCLPVLRRMQSSHYSLTYRTLAQTYLLEHLKEQQKLGLWHLYWRTTLEIVNFEIPWEQLIMNTPMFASLTFPENAQVFLAMTTGMDREVLTRNFRILAGCHPALFAEVVLVLGQVEPEHVLVQALRKRDMVTEQRFFQPAMDDQRSPVVAMKVIRNGV